MNILFQSRIDLFEKVGGDTIQVRELKKSLENIGVKVDIDLGNEPNLDKYDLVNIFNLDWCRESYLQAINTKIQGKPIVLSAIHHSISEMEEYEKKARFGIRRLTGAFFSSWYTQEYLKEIYRAVLDPRKIRPTLTQFSQGIKKQQVKILEMADLVLVQTEGEKKDIEKDFAVKVKTKLVVNGVDSSFKDSTKDRFLKKFGFNDFIICVGRIEPRKNQLAIIEAMSDLNTRLVFVGSYNWNHPEYIVRFKNKVSENPFVTHILHIPYNEIGSAYAASKVAVSASWFETTGLTSLEALLAGSSVVASGERVKEYLGKYAHYCKPDNISSIKTALEKALKTKPKEGAKKYILDNFTWDIAAKQSKEAYEEVLGNS